MASLISIIRSCYEDPHTSRSSTTNRTYNDKNAYMEIPIDKDSFEMPTFAFSSMRYAFVQQSECKAIVANLCDFGYRVSYKSLDANIRAVLDSSFPQKNLLKIVAGDKPYYITQGIILDEDFNILLLMTWEVHRNANADSPYHLTRPVMRVNPMVYRDKNNSMYRYIINKIVTSAVQIPRVYDNMFEYNNYYTIKIIVDTIPFNITYTEAPSISTTNKELLDIAVAYSEELLQ